MPVVKIEMGERGELPPRGGTFSFFIMTHIHSVTQNIQLVSSSPHCSYWLPTSEYSCLLEAPTILKYSAFYGHYYGKWYISNSRPISVWFLLCQNTKFYELHISYTLIWTCSFEWTHTVLSAPSRLFVYSYFRISGSSLEYHPCRLTLSLLAGWISSKVIVPSVLTRLLHHLRINLFLSICCYFSTLCCLY